MRNITWTKPDSTQAFTTISDEIQISSQGYASSLQMEGIIPVEWRATAFDQELNNLGE